VRLRVKVPLARSPYEVLAGDGLLSECGPVIREACPRANACAVIADSVVAPLYADAVAASLRGAGITPHVLVFPSGEASKSMACAAGLLDRMIAAGLDRTSCTAALGGGVTGDLAGFVSAIFYRGIPYFGLPTTLLAQVDSSVGGKTGVNAPGGKNLIGAFHQPVGVIADTSTLSSLPPREFNEGFAEIIKHGLIRDAALVADSHAFSRSRDPAALARLVARNIEIKAAIVAADEFETTGLRALLNFGHTVGHAVEQAAGYGRFLHGEAISIGIAAALRLSVKLAGLDPAAESAALAALAAFGLPVRLPADLSDAALLAALGRDKKFDRGAIRFVLCPEPGRAFVSKDVALADITAALAEIRETHPEPGIEA